MPKALIVVGLGFGDEGKGSVCDYFARRENADIVVRFNGGAQAAHNVVTPDGRHHTFSQFGSGTFVPGCQTHLSRFMLVNPIFMEAEEKHLRSLGVLDAYARTTVDRDALVTTPFHVAANRLREMIRDAVFNRRQATSGRHGSCGMGIGETMQDSIEHPDDVIRVRDLVFTRDDSNLRRKLSWLQEVKRHDLAAEILRVPTTPEIAQEWDILNDSSLVGKIIERFNDWKRRVCFTDRGYLSSALQEGVFKTAIFEGAQGVLLDENLGFHPHTTWSTTTFQNALELLQDTGCEVRKIGVLRAYHTRHGAGPFPTATTEMDLPEAHNRSDHAFQQSFRVGCFDSMLLRYALHAAGSVDEIAMTHLDRLPGAIRVCVKYQAPHGGAKFDDFQPHGAGTLHGQQELGRILGFLKPLHRTLPDHDAFLRHVEDIAKCPVRITSYGPTANDKRAR